jgi:hypothetical protein
MTADGISRQFGFHKIVGTPRAAERPRRYRAREFEVQRTICCIARVVFAKTSSPCRCNAKERRYNHSGIERGELLEDLLMMKPQSETRTSPLNEQTTRVERFVRAQRFGRSFCPRCKEMLLAPTMSEYVKETLVRHLWSCDVCGYEFQSAVRLTKVSARRRGNTLS